MHRLFAAFALIAAAACSPPGAPAEAPAAEAPAAETAAAEAADYGPYSNSWRSGEEANFRHTLHARTPGEHTLTIHSRTDSPGGETVAIYPIGPDGQPTTVRIMFVIASTIGTTETASLTFPASGEGVPVAVIVEHDRRFGGEYTLTVE
jgi:hypothetical protein